MVSALSSNPLSLAARALIGGTISNDELPIASPTGVYGCARWGPLVGVLAGTSDPSEIGTSAASVTRVLRRPPGGPGKLVRPLSLLSISARLVLALMRLLIRGSRTTPQYQLHHGHVHAPLPDPHPMGGAVLLFPIPPCLSGRWNGTQNCPFRGVALNNATQRDNKIMAMCSLLMF